MTLQESPMKSLRQAYFDLSLRLPVEDIKVLQRLDRGYDITQSYGYTIDKVSSSDYHIHRESTSLLDDNAITYIVTKDSCTCPDYETARGGLCKHRLAVMLLEEMMKDACDYRQSVGNVRTIIPAFTSAETL